MIAEPTKRFSNRVENYIKYRPGYPQEAIDFLQKQFGLTSLSVVADVGSGTGIFTKLLLNKVYRVYAVEPNEPMRQAAEEDLKSYPSFISIPGSAEHTNLATGSIDLITSATAFHWFNLEETKKEFQRILKPAGAVALLWNMRMPDADNFAKAYTNLLDNYATDHTAVKDKTTNGLRLNDFFDSNGYQTTKFINHQEFDLQGLIGRALSSSFVPLPDTPEGKIFFEKLKAIFEEHQVNGKVNFHYDTTVYTGRV